ncbi:hypothetical protein MCOR07_007527 [Pyricularia oryzae]|nr:hypothetical protein MCOR28_008327 [Pyricularia oryzae]KAI6426660.1 hypothetical protein MCOR22_010794 [Pyricularia oryzae]KAI6455764.1 hypothetical protein MCOR17_008551 [Pyricularia oryzae]KAI6468832.1 hypothetical protein MCOR18_009403 [Pyricularia oryzae]KAI6520267.1 hypothetical protein MCOR05_010865 [Pyricularia oryzae]
MPDDFYVARMSRGKIEINTPQPQHHGLYDSVPTKYLSKYHATPEEHSGFLCAPMTWSNGLSKYSSLRIILHTDFQAKMGIDQQKLPNEINGQTSRLTGSAVKDRIHFDQMTGSSLTSRSATYTAISDDMLCNYV